MVRNSIIRSRAEPPELASELAYKEWLRKYRSDDFNNEFVTKIRQNEKLHVIWDETPADAEQQHRYTRADTNELDMVAVSGSPALLRSLRTCV